MEKAGMRKQELTRRCAALCMALAMLLICVGCGGGVGLHSEEDTDPDTSAGETAEPSGEISSDAPGDPDQPDGSDPPMPSSGGQPQTPGEPSAVQLGTDPMQGGPEGPNGVTDMFDEYHVALVMDTSGTMSTSDPDRAALWAPCMFLDTMFISDTHGEDRSGMPNTKIGLYWYNDEAHSMYASGNMQTLSEVENVEVLKDYIRNNVRVSPGSGDDALGEALTMALDALEQNRASGSARELQESLPDPTLEPGADMTFEFTDGANIAEALKEKEMILLFTDGFSGYAGPDMTGDMPYYFNDASRQAVRDAVETAKELGVEIYIIGLAPTADGRTPNPEADAMNGSWAAFMALADSTQGTMDPNMGGPGMGGNGQPDPNMGGPGMGGGGQPDPNMGGPGMGGNGQPDPNMGGPGGGPGMGDSVSGVFDGLNYCLCGSVKAVHAAYVRMTGAMVLQGSGAEQVRDVNQRRDNMWEYTINVEDAGNAAMVIYLLSDTLNLDRLSLWHYPVGASEPDQQYISYPKEARSNPLDTYYQESISENGREVIRDNWWVKHDHEDLPERKVRCPFYVGCATIAVIEPEVGRWVVQARGDEPEAWSIQIGGIKFRMGLEQDPDSPRTGVVRVWADLGTRSMEKSFYDNILSKCTCSVFLDNGEGKPEPVVTAGAQPQPEQLYAQNVTLRYSDEDHGLRGTFTAAIPGSYKVEFSLDSAIDYKTETGFLRLWPGTPRESVSISRLNTEKKTLSPRFSEWSGIPLQVVDGSAYCALLETEAADAQTVKLTGTADGTGVLTMEVDFYNASVAGGEGQGGYRWRIQYPVGVMQDPSSVQVDPPEYVGRILDQRAATAVPSTTGGGLKTLTIGLAAAVIFIGAGAAVAVTAMKRKH